MIRRSFGRSDLATLPLVEDSENARQVMRRLQLSDEACRDAMAFAGPPVAIMGADLLMRLAIHNSHWGAVPLYLMFVVGGCVSCFIFAFRYAQRVPGPAAVGRFVAWVLASALCIAGGMGLVALLHIAPGDGP